MSQPRSFSEAEIALVTGEDSFRKKARITERIKGMLEATYAALQEETGRTALLQPSDLSRSHFQFVKGEHHGRREATGTVQGPYLRAWKRGGGYPIPPTHDWKATVSAVLAERVFIRFVRYVALVDPRVRGGMTALAREAILPMKPIVFT